jgi:hypothetical protein
MKEKILATLVAFGMVGSASAIEINENLTINGFIDGSYKHVDNGSISGAGTTTDQELGLDEIELNFLFNVGGASGAIHIDDHDNNPGNYAADGDIDVEQAFIGYSLDSGLSFQLGKYGSNLGFEREDPQGLYTFSRAYGGNSANAFNLGDVDNNVVEGLRIGYATDVFGITASFQNDGDADGEEDELDLEVSLTYTGIENLVLGGGYHFDNQATNNTEVDVLNVHASTTMGKFLLAAEFTELDRTDGGDLDGWLFLADYDVSDKLGVALRVSSNEQTGNSDYERVTLAPNYSLSDSLGVILEYSDVENQGVDGNELAIEFTFTF